MLYQTLLTYKYDNGGRPEQINVDQLGDYPTEYVYRTLAGESRPKKVLISDLQSETSDYIIYCVDEEGETVRAPKSRTLGSTWAGKMIRSYQERNPEQKTWFDMITVNTIAERDALQNDPDFEPESWIRVLNDGTGSSREYVLSANRQFWVNTAITGLSQASGSLARDELYSRLSSGYLFDTFGPSGQDKSVCDFVYAFAIDGNLTARAWTKSGDTARWDFGDGSPVLNNGVPAHTFVPGNNVVTVSVEDSFNTVTRYYFRNGSFIGAIPKMDFVNITTVSDCFRGCRFSGAVPYLDLRNATAAGSYLNGATITSIPDIELTSLTGDSIGIFYTTKITNKIGKLTFQRGDTQDSINLTAMFRQSTISRADFDITIGEGFTGTDIFAECYNLDIPDLSKITPFYNDGAEGYDSKQAALLAACNLRAVDNDRTDNKRPLDMLISNISIIYDSNLRHLPPFTLEDYTLPYTYEPMISLAPNALQSANLTTQSLKNIVKFVYDSRFVVEGDTDPNQFTSVVLDDFLINLQPHDNSGLGQYRNTKTPRFANEFIYKLVENPENEDRNSYKVLYDKDGDARQEKIELDVIVDSATPVTLDPITSTIRDDEKIIIDWGDGEVSEYTSELGGLPGYVFEKTYSVSGNYTIKLTWENFNTRSISFPYSAGGKIIGFSGLDIINIYFNSSLMYAFYGFYKGLATLENVYHNTNMENKVVAYLATEMFMNCTSLRHIDPIYMAVGGASSDTAVGDMFTNTGSIESVVLLEMNRSFDISNNQLDDAALNALFQGLADVTNNPQTITVTGNPGIGVGVYDTTIATNKGWTVVDPLPSPTPTPTPTPTPSSSGA